MQSQTGNSFFYVNFGLFPLSVWPMCIGQSTWVCSTAHKLTGHLGMLFCALINMQICKSIYVPGKELKVSE